MTTPRSQQSPQSAPQMKLQSLSSRGNPIASLAASLRTPIAASLCKDLEPTLERLPAKVAELVQAGFVKLLGDLHAVEQRLLSQTKVREDLSAALLKLPPTRAVHQRVKEAEEAYRKHIQRLSTKDKEKARKLQEANSRAQRFTDRFNELSREVERLRGRRLRQRSEEKQRKSVGVDDLTGTAVKELETLRLGIEAAKCRIELLRKEVPAYDKIKEENAALCRRLSILSGHG